MPSVKTQTLGGHGNNRTPETKRVLVLGAHPVSIRVGLAKLREGVLPVQLEVVKATIPVADNALHPRSGTGLLLEAVFANGAAAPTGLLPRLLATEVTRFLGVLVAHLMECWNLDGPETDSGKVIAEFLWTKTL